MVVRVSVLHEQPLCFTVQLPRLFQPDFWIYAQRQGAILIVKAVMVTPVFAAARRLDEQVQSAAIKQLVGCLPTELFNGFFGQSHGVERREAGGL